jgi:hypothetical protein
MEYDKVVLLKIKYYYGATRDVFSGSWRRLSDLTGADSLPRTGPNGPETGRADRGSVGR